MLGHGEQTSEINFEIELQTYRSVHYLPLGHAMSGTAIASTVTQRQIFQCAAFRPGDGKLLAACQEDQSIFKSYCWLWLGVCGPHFACNVQLLWPFFFSLGCVGADHMLNPDCATFCANTLCVHTSPACLTSPREGKLELWS